MDDLKLYGRTEQKLHKMLKLTENFSDCIGMNFGIEKCCIQNIYKGRLIQPQENNEKNIPIMGPENIYKYLGYEQNKRMEHKKIVTELKQKFMSQINKIARTKLNSHNLTKAINTFAVPMLTYSFGIIKWSKIELEGIERQIRVTLTQNKKLHPNAAIERQNIPRTEGGRGIIDLINLHTKQTYGLKRYFHQKSKESMLHRAIREADKGYTALNLNSELPEQIPKWNQETIAEKVRIWKQKSLHGRYPAELEMKGIHKTASLMRLKKGNLFPETEAFIMAIQDQVINTSNYRKYIIKEDTNDDCRICGKKPETIQHMIAGCEKLAQTEYTERHNNVAKTLHRALVLKYKMKKSVEPYYNYTPEKKIENEEAKIYWDRTIITDKTVTANRPDITIHEKKTKKILLIDIAVPNTVNVERTIKTKLEKYATLAEEMKKGKHVNSVIVLPVVISATGIIPQRTVKSMNMLIKRSDYVIEAMQKAALLSTTQEQCARCYPGTRTNSLQPWPQRPVVD
jgi:hypothetical protein